MSDKTLFDLEADETELVTNELILNTCEKLKYKEIRKNDEYYDGSAKPLILQI